MSLVTVNGTLTALATWDTALGSVADSGASTAGEVNSSTPTVFFEVELDADGATTGSVDIYLLESLDDGTDFTTTDDLSHALFVGSVLLNGTTLVRKTLRVTDVADDWQLHIVNNSGSGLGANSLISYRTRTVNNA